METVNYSRVQIISQNENVLSKTLVHLLGRINFTLLDRGRTIWTASCTFAKGQSEDMKRKEVYIKKKRKEIIAAHSFTVIDNTDATNLVFDASVFFLSACLRGEGDGEDFFFSFLDFLPFLAPIMWTNLSKWQKKQVNYLGKIARQFLEPRTIVKEFVNIKPANIMTQKGWYQCNKEHKTYLSVLDLNWSTANTWIQQNIRKTNWKSPDPNRQKCWPNVLLPTSMTTMTLRTWNTV